MFAEIPSLAILNTVAFLLCVYFCAYVLSILVLHLRAVRAGGGDYRQLSWHIIVPCRNEATVIAATLRRLLHDMPDVTVWCVDDDSDDGTGKVLRSFAADSRVRVVTRRRPEAVQGKGAALNAAWRAIRDHLPADADAERTIVGVLDADSQLDPRCRSALAGPRYFGSPSVAAVQIEVRMVQCSRPTPELNRWGRLLIRLQDMEFRAPIAAMQALRRHTRSVAMGGNGQFTRLSLLNALGTEHGTPWHGALLEDFELGLHILLHGGGTEYCAESWVTQEALTKVRPLIRQRTRWAQGSMQCVRYLNSVLNSRQIGNPAIMEITHFLAAPWCQLVGTPIYLGCAGVLGWYISRTEGGIAAWWTSGGWGLIPLVVLFGVSPFAVWGLVYRNRCEPHLSLSAALGLGIAHWVYSYLQSIAVWIAFGRMLTARSDWHKTARAADPPPTPVRPDPTSVATGPHHPRPQRLTPTGVPAIRTSIGGAQPPLQDTPRTIPHLINSNRE
ncbi:glycosyltransferase family 2 protein [Micromonospora sp. HUAS LYJ1]|uniref:glycosyltransferase family 2 protein n=1 Tax=Micromonospora sp. HUAS LYJ1 TaxID=3061626 RepID=UPI002673DBEC|nr:glycosyltransferase family 2 protein [Micromonospora sp. HUAS LYJ1]WKU03373.1 glycosyltransferase family 2 protein [Micromonospora sp. HUAS LYJ1]